MYKSMESMRSEVAREAEKMKAVHVACFNDRRWQT